MQNVDYGGMANGGMDMAGQGFSAAQDFGGDAFNAMQNIDMPDMGGAFGDIGNAIGGLFD